MQTEPSKFELLDSQHFDHEIGPFDLSLPGPFKIKLRLDGEVIVGSKIETGLFHRGIEAMFGALPPSHHVVLCDRIDPEAAFFLEDVYCRAVEKLNKIEVSEKSELVRVVLSELNRISCHQLFLARLGKVLGNQTFYQYVTRDRESVLDLLELITGSRFSFNFYRVGGLRTNVSEGFMERVLGVCETLRERVDEYNNFITHNPSFLSRTIGLAPISAGDASESGLTGPTARAAGLKEDLRKSDPYGGYQKVETRIVVGDGDHGILGDVHHRFRQRLFEISESIRLIKETAKVIPIGIEEDRSSFTNLKLKKGDVVTEVEGPRGRIACQLRVENGEHEVSFLPSSAPLFYVLESALLGQRLEDVGLIVASLQISVSENDR